MDRAPLPPVRLRRRALWSARASRASSWLAIALLAVGVVAGCFYLWGGPRHETWAGPLAAGVLIVAAGVWFAYVTGLLAYGIGLALQRRRRLRTGMRTAARTVGLQEGPPDFSTQSAAWSTLRVAFEPRPGHLVAGIAVVSSAAYPDRRPYRDGESVEIAFDPRDFAKGRPLVEPPPRVELLDRGRGVARARLVLVLNQFVFPAWFILVVVGLVAGLLWT